MIIKTEILEHGKNLNKISYGICKKMVWHLYSYKGERYNVSMFSDKVDIVPRMYCNECGRATYSIKVLYGEYCCPTCYNEMK